MDDYKKKTLEHCIQFIINIKLLKNTKIMVLHYLSYTFFVILTD